MVVRIYLIFQFFNDSFICLYFFTTTAYLKVLQFFFLEFVLYLAKISVKMLYTVVQTWTKLGMSLENCSQKLNFFQMAEVSSIHHLTKTKIDRLFIFKTYGRKFCTFAICNFINVVVVYKKCRTLEHAHSVYDIKNGKLNRKEDGRVSETYCKHGKFKWTRVKLDEKKILNNFEQLTA